MNMYYCTYVSCHDASESLLTLFRARTEMEVQRERAIDSTLKLLAASLTATQERQLCTHL